MNIKFSPKEKLIINYLQKMKVTTKINIYRRFDVSSRTIDRALIKYGYYSSYNYNASFYTLKDIPKFNNYGLWHFKDIRFSKYNTLTATIGNIINKSESGFTNKEMSLLLGTETKIILSRLFRNNQIAKFNIGHRAIYLSTDQEKLKIQKESRIQSHLMKVLRQQQDHLKYELLPEGIEAKIVIMVLLQLIIRSDISPVSISKKIQFQKVNILTREVRKIISFYGLA
jgi:hypothetical protein